MLNVYTLFGWQVFCIFNTNHGNTSVITKSLQKSCINMYDLSQYLKKNDVPVKANSRLNDSQKEIKKKTRKIRINYLMVLFFTDRYILR